MGMCNAPRSRPADAAAARLACLGIIESSSAGAPRMALRGDVRGCLPAPRAAIGAFIGHRGMMAGRRAERRAALFRRLA